MVPPVYLQVALSRLSGNERVNSWYDLAHRRDLRIVVGKGTLLSKYFLVSSHSTTSKRF
jgi:hypothetical protein